METDSHIEPIVAGYLAGFFDGEGCICLARRTDTYLPRFMLTIEVGQVDPRPLELFKSLFGGIIRRIEPSGRRKKIFHDWRIHGKEAIKCLKILLPYLVVKQEKADLVIRFWSMPWRGKRGGIGTGKYISRTAEQVSIDESYWERVKNATTQQVASIN